MKQPAGWPESDGQTTFVDALVERDFSGSGLSSIRTATRSGSRTDEDAGGRMPAETPSRARLTASSSPASTASRSGISAAGDRWLERLGR